MLSSSLFLGDTNTVTIKWSSQVPAALNTSLSVNTVNELHLYALDIDDKQWKRVGYTFEGQLNSSVPFSVNINDNLYIALRTTLKISTAVVPVTFQVKQTISPRLSKPFTYWSWSGIYYLPSQQVNRDLRLSFGRMCREPIVEAEGIMLTSCPPTEFQASRLYSGYEVVEFVSPHSSASTYSKNYYQYFYGPVQLCYIQSNINR